MLNLEAQPWLDTSKPPRERAELLVAAMTLEQKIAQLHGGMQTIDIYAMSTAVNGAAGLPDQARTARARS